MYSQRQTLLDQKKEPDADQAVLDGLLRENAMAIAERQAQFKGTFQFDSTATEPEPETAAPDATPDESILRLGTDNALYMNPTSPGQTGSTFAGAGFEQQTQAPPIYQPDAQFSEETLPPLGLPHLAQPEAPTLYADNQGNVGTDAGQIHTESVRREHSAYPRYTGNEDQDRQTYAGRMTGLNKVLSEFNWKPSDKARRRHFNAVIKERRELEKSARQQAMTQKQSAYTPVNIVDKIKAMKQAYHDDQLAAFDRAMADIQAENQRERERMLRDEYPLNDQGQDSRLQNRELSQQEEVTHPQWFKPFAESVNLPDPDLLAEDIIERKAYAEDNGKVPTYTVKRPLGGGRSRFEVYNLQGKKVATSIHSHRASKAAIKKNAFEIANYIFDVTASWQAPALIDPVSSKDADTLRESADNSPSNQGEKIDPHSSDNFSDEPSDAQKEAGNYKKTHIKLQGLDLSLENLKGSTRSGTDPHGKPWSVKMRHDYGYIKGTEGADGDHVDVFVGDNPDSEKVFVVDQVNKDGSFDEHKVMLGFDDRQSAVDGYKANYEKGWTVGDVTELSTDAFKQWLKEGNTREPLAGQTLEAQKKTTPDTENAVKKTDKKTDSQPAKKKQPDAKQSSEKFDDFGEQLGGARKDQSGRRLLSPTKKKDTDSKATKKPGYYRHYEISERITGKDKGKWVLRRDSSKRKSLWTYVGMFDTREEAEQVIPVYEMSIKHRVREEPRDSGQWEVYRRVTDRKRFPVKKGFSSRDEAMRWMIQNADEVISFKTALGDEIRPNLEEVDRRGTAHRKGNVRPEDFQNTFGFYAGQFGNWNTSSDRQADLNYAYDALMDLAEVLDVPPQALSLNGELAIAFGARGHGLSGAKAHYERNFGVINLTKMNGAGSLAHEWMHALDHYLGRQDGKASPAIENPGKEPRFNARKQRNDYVSHGFGYKSDVRDALRKQWDALMDTLTRTTEEYLEDGQQFKKTLASRNQQVTQTLAGIRELLAADYTDASYVWKKRHRKPATKEQLAEFDKLATTLEKAVTDNERIPIDWVERANAKKPGFTNDTLNDISVLLKKVRGRSGWSEKGKLTKLADRINWRNGSLDLYLSIEKKAKRTRKRPTDFVGEAHYLDQGRTGDYWGTRHELLARAFESYVFDQIHDKNLASDYLAYGVTNEHYQFLGVKPYPEGNERKRFNEAFSKVFKTLKHRKTDNGTQLYSLRTTPAKGLKRGPLRLKLAPLEKKLGVPVTVLQAESQLPRDVYQGIVNDKAQGRVRGVFSNGHAFIVADNLDSTGEAVKTVLHEVVGHKGVRAVLGKRLDKTLDQIYRDMPDKLIDELRTTYSRQLEKKGTTEGNRIVAEEYLAHLAESDSQNTLLKKIYALLRNALRQLFPRIQWQPNDVVELLAASRKALKQRSGSGANKNTQRYHDGKVADTFYSAVERGAAAVKSDTLPAQSWLNAIKKQPNVTDEEIQWLGLDTWLTSKKGEKLEKQDVLDYIRANRVEIVEVKYGSPTKEEYNDQEDVYHEQWIDSVSEHFGYGEIASSEWQELVGNHRGLLQESKQKRLEKDLREALKTGRHEDPDRFFDEDGNIIEEEIEEYSSERAIDHINDMYDEEIFYEIPDKERRDFAERMYDRYGRDGFELDSPTQYDSYSTPGGEDYTELLLTLPENVMAADRTDYFSSHHWDEGNVLAHVRFQTFHDKDKNKVLLVDEVQSDWHQKGRDKGYVDPAHKKSIEAEIEQLEQQQRDIVKQLWPEIEKDRMGFLMSHGEKGSLSRVLRPWVAGENILSYAADYIYNKHLAIKEVANSYGIDTPLKSVENKIEELIIELRRTDRVPNAPLKDNWPNLVMKRMIRHAAENGFDQVAWTTGEQQVLRYGLGREIISVKAKPRFGVDLDNTMRLDFFDVEVKDINGQTRRYDQDAALLEDIVGNNLGRQIRSQANTIKEQLDGEIQKWRVQPDKQNADKYLVTDPDGNTHYDSNDDAFNSQDSAHEFIADYIGSHSKETVNLDNLNEVVGGDGMNAFYDNRLVNFMKKYTKKWGGKVGKIELETGDGNERFWSVPVTEKMKDSVMKDGQPRFSLKGDGEQRGFQQRLHKMLHSRNARVHHIKVMNTPKALEYLGAKKQPLTIARRIITKSTKGSHSVSMSVVEQLPELLNDPELIFTGSKEGSYAVVVKAWEGDKPVMVAVNIRGGSIDSIHGRTPDQYKLLYKNNQLRYYKDNESLGLMGESESSLDYTLYAPVQFQGGERQPRDSRVRLVNAKTLVKTSTGQRDSDSDSDNRYSLKQDIPNDVEKVINDIHGGTRKNRKGWVERVKDWLKEHPDFSARKAIAQDTLDSYKDRIAQGTLDSFHSIAVMERGENGGKLMEAARSAWKAALRTTNLVGVMTAILGKGTPKLVDGSVTLAKGSKGFLELFEGIAQQGELELWEVWAGSKRAMRLLREGRENLYTPERIKTIQTYVKSMPGMEARFQKVFDDYQRFNRQILDFAQDAGLIDAKTRKLWDKGDYIPFHRINELAENVGEQMKVFRKRGLSGQKSGIKELKGGVERISPIEAMFRNTQAMVDASFKNIAMRRIADLGVETGAMTLTKGGVRLTASDVTARLKEMGLSTDELTPEQMKRWQSLLGKFTDLGDGVVTVSRDGKTETYQVNDPLLLASIVDLGPQNATWLMKLLSLPKRLLTASVTADPAFMLRNLIRDSLSTWMVVHPEINGKALKVNPMTAALRTLNKKLENDDTRWNIMMAGGGSSEFYDLTPDNVRTELTSANKKGLTIHTPGQAWRWWKTFGARFENANRFHVYEQVIKQGGSVAEAAHQAQDVLNFSMRGQWQAMRLLVSALPFFNARLQGLYKLWRGAKAGGKSGWAGIAPSFLLRGSAYAAASAALIALYDDDERYKKLPEHEKVNYHHLWFDDQHIRIPKPFEVGAIFGTVPEIITQTAMGKEELKWAKKMAANIMLQTLEFDPVPQAFRPMLDVATNKDSFTQAPIVPMGLQFVKPEAQFDPWSSETVKQMTRMVPEGAPDWMRSPKKLQHLLQGYFGTLGAYVLSATDLVTRQAVDAPARPDRLIQDIPVVGSFVRDGEGRTRYRNEMQEMQKELNELMTTINRYKNNGRTKDARAMIQENKRRLQARRQINRYGDRISKLNKKIRHIMDNRLMSATTKRQRIDAISQQINQLSAEAVAKYGDRF
ncbi:LPD38 domain-containing protein [Candidatus Sororendozoicomonas aggregata]|uniref:LPD38 domain-containing protein n=1 Tax=Candidatus Sororendozoicomonas aggregata TaxID=3073239 RepID=UPI002ED23D45